MLAKPSLYISKGSFILAPNHVSQIAAKLFVGKGKTVIAVCTCSGRGGCNVRVQQSSEIGAELVAGVAVQITVAVVGVCVSLACQICVRVQIVACVVHP